MGKNGKPVGNDKESRRSRVYSKKVKQTRTTNIPVHSSQYNTNGEVYDEQDH
jgi:hypothetical protein